MGSEGQVAGVRAAVHEAGTPRLVRGQLLLAQETLITGPIDVTETIKVFTRLRVVWAHHLNKLRNATTAQEVVGVSGL